MYKNKVIFFVSFPPPRATLNKNDIAYQPFIEKKKVKTQ